MALGAISFLAPLIWVVGIASSGLESRSRPSRWRESRLRPARRRAGEGPVEEGRTKEGREEQPAKAGTAETAAGWRLSPFRLLLFAAFSLLSLQATRNSHQFAAVVGSVTAWNFGEWAAAIRRRRVALSSPGSESAPSATPPPGTAAGRRGRHRLGAGLGRLGRGSTR